MILLSFMTGSLKCWYKWHLGEDATEPQEFYKHFSWDTLYAPTNHQKTHSLEVPLDLLDPRDALLDPLGPLNIPLDLLTNLNCLTNHQRTYQMWPLTTWNHLHVCLDPLVPPRRPPRAPPLTPNQAKLPRELVTYTFAQFTLGLVSKPTKLSSVHFISRPIWSCYTTSVSEWTRKNPMKSKVGKSAKNSTNRKFTQINSTER